MKSIMDKMGNSKNDPRANLLLSLKPYLKESRKSKVEQYVGLLNMTKIIDVLHENGGEKIKWCFHTLILSLLIIIVILGMDIIILTLIMLIKLLAQMWIHNNLVKNTMKIQNLK